MIAGGMTTRWLRPHSPRKPDTYGMHPGAETALLSRYGAEPFDNAALVGGGLYIAAMRDMLVGFRERPGVPLGEAGRPELSGSDLYSLIAAEDSGLNLIWSR